MIWIALGALLGIAVLVMLSGRFSGAVEVQTATVVTAYPSQQFTLLNATGYVVAQRKAAVSSKGTGRLEWLNVTEGSRVKENEVIARLENRDVTATMENAAANIKVAQANLSQGDAEYKDATLTLERSKDLLAKGFVSKSTVDTAQARFNKAKAALAGYQAAISMAQASYRGAQVAVEYTQIRAPFDGVILSKSANIGDVITPFSSAAESKGAVVTMADMSTLEVEADVSESNLQKVKVGQPCEIQLDALPDTRFRAVVSRIVPTVDRAKATVMTKVKFIDRDPRILPEMSAKVAFLTQEMNRDQEKPLTAVNPATVVERSGKTVAFVIRDDKAVETPVKLGQKLGDVTAVESGLKPGDRVVLQPSDKVKNGVAIKVAAKK